MNYYKKIAEMLGVELNEEFSLKNNFKKINLYVGNIIIGVVFLIYKLIFSGVVLWKRKEGK